MKSVLSYVGRPQLLDESVWELEGKAGSRPRLMGEERSRREGVVTNSVRDKHTERLRPRQGSTGVPPAVWTRGRAASPPPQGEAQTHRVGGTSRESRGPARGSPLPVNKAALSQLHFLLGRVGFGPGGQKPSNHPESVATGNGPHPESLRMFPTRFCR